MRRDNAREPEFQRPLQKQLFWVKFVPFYTDRTRLIAERCGLGNNLARMVGLRQEEG